jgi:thiopeptide-type bacteriocin biosynthesis protein
VAGPERPSIASEYAPDGFFVFRTPLLPFEEIEQWSAGLAAPTAPTAPAAAEGPAIPPAGTEPEPLAAALAADRRILRTRLAALLERPEILEAVFVASPALIDGLEIWKREPDGKKGQRAERALVRYFLRMASRATPFGLFSGCSTAEFAVPPSSLAKVAPSGRPLRAAAAAPPSPPPALTDPRAPHDLAGMAANPAAAHAADGANAADAADTAADAADTAADAAAPTRLTLAPRAAYRRHTRLDMDYLFALCEELERDAAMRRELRYRPNSSLYRAAGRLRYAEARLEDKVRSHHLVAVESSDYLEATLKLARNGVRAVDLAAALVTTGAMEPSPANGTNATSAPNTADSTGGTVTEEVDRLQRLARDGDGSGESGGESPGAAGEDASSDDLEITQEDADAFIAELIDSQVLVSDLSPPVTGPEAIHDLVHHLAGLAAGQDAARRLAAARDVLSELDAGGPGAAPDRYRAIAADLAALPTPVELARLFQVDMVKPPAEAALSPAVLDQVTAGLDLLRRLSGRARAESLDNFRKDFQARYGDQREMPLVEAMDEEIGVGFERSSEVGAEASPLLRGMALAPPAGDPSYPWGARQAVLLGKIQQARAEGAHEIELTAEDLDKMAPPTTAPPQRLPDAFQVIASLAAASPEALDRGEFQILIGGAAGPSGGRLLGRFCHADELLCQRTREHLRAEEALRPQAVFAEIVHLPQGRIGNILSRPVLRDYEIPFLGRSGADEEHQIPVADLLVSVQGSRIVLRSRRLDREVVPRLTSAHNFSMRSLGIYRFLCTLQHQEILGGLGWNWGPLESSPFLPRVTHGKIVLSRAAWWMTGDEIKSVAKVQGNARWTAVQDWRRRRKLPRLLMLADGDNELLVDLDNVLSIDAFLDVIEERDRARLIELFPEPDRLIASGPEGRFVHEVVIPMHRLATPPQDAAAPAGAAAASVAAAAENGTAPGGAKALAANAHPVRRSFAPGSEWLYAKLYTGTATADRVLREVVAPLARQAVDGGVADSWFFIRYADPDWHLRVRFHGDPTTLSGRLLPALHAAAAPQLDDGRLWKLQLDTYEREVERYGGPLGIGLAEGLFRADSEAVVEILDMMEGDEGADVRWRLAFYGVDALLNDLRLDPAAKLEVLSRMRQGFAQEFATSGPESVKALQVQLDQRFRTERPKLDPLLDAGADPASPLAPALHVLARRSQAMAPILDELRRLEAGNLLDGSIVDMAASLAHMHVNRFIRSSARAHELVLYDFLYQTHRSRAARARKQAAASA